MFLKGRIHDMPIKIPNSLPATQILDKEHIFVMTEYRALSQDIRPLKIAILNLMPTKIVTETQLLRLLSNSPLQVEVTLLQMGQHVSKNTAPEHLLAFYSSFDDVKTKRFDGLIITGAPVELLDFNKVDYWDELCEVMEWSKKRVFSTFHICWGAQAALYYHYGIKKYTLDEKMFGVFDHKLLNKSSPLVRGFDESFLAPHSRHTEVRAEDIRKVDDLSILAQSDEAGVFIVEQRAGRQVYVMGHLEYDAETLSLEYFRDVDRGLNTKIPKNYFPDDDPHKTPSLRWRSHASLLFSNWLNYYVYQTTPYDLESLEDIDVKYDTANYTV